MRVLLSPAAALTLVATLIASQGFASGLSQTRFEEIPFSVVDHNADGYIDENEFNSSFRMPGTSFYTLDQDQDGLVSVTEARIGYDAYRTDQGMITPPPDMMALEEAPRWSFWSFFTPPSAHPRREIIDAMKDRRERRWERRGQQIPDIFVPYYPWPWDDCMYDCDEVIPQ
jgi:hypothetical protein